LIDSRRVARGNPRMEISIKKATDVDVGIPDNRVNAREESFGELEPLSCKCDIPLQILMIHIVVVFAIFFMPL
jgi:hypothetical protein